jgi:hypothetical protein
LAWLDLPIIIAATAESFWERAHALSALRTDDPGRRHSLCRLPWTVAR